MNSKENLSFMAHILKYINDMAFNLNASLPLARHGLLGIDGRKEIWILKSSKSW